MKQRIEFIDLGDTEPVKIPYGERKHVAFLVGSGFLVPCGMPRQLNDYVFNVKE